MREGGDPGEAGWRGRRTRQVRARPPDPD